MARERIQEFVQVLLEELQSEAREHLCRIIAFYAFPKEHWKHLRTTNPVESPFAAVRLRTAAGKRYKKVANATALIWRVLLVAEQSFRRLDHPELLPEVAEGALYEDGERVKRTINCDEGEAAAA